MKTLIVASILVAFASTAQAAPVKHALVLCDQHCYSPAQQAEQPAKPKKEKKEGGISLFGSGSLGY